MHRNANFKLSYHKRRPPYQHSTMGHDEDDEATQSLLDQSEIIKTNEIEDSYVRNLRDPKMFGLLQCLLVFAVLITFVYGVQVAVRDDLIEGKTKILQENIKSIPLWTYDCTNKTCIRRSLNSSETETTLENCNMLCNMPSLWPKPRSVHVKNKTLSSFTKHVIKTKISSPKIVEEILKRAIDVFLVNLPATERFPPEDLDLTKLFINITVISDETRILVETDESYSLTVKRIKNYVTANITAETFFGARHGLETLNQLILTDLSKYLQIYHDVEIQDSPAFPHRGLMIDTARNFIPLEQLLNILDGMAMNKMNVFHWHVTDAVSFPIVLPSNPWMAKYGAYGPDMVYTPDDVRGLIDYAKIRGVRVIMEIDAPSHANSGWNHRNTDKEKVIICGEDDVFNGHLNPDSNKAKSLLETVYSDLLELGTDNETFHIGGDEVNLECLAQTVAARKFESMFDFWADYVNKIFQTVGRAFRNNPPKNLVIWSSDLTDKKLHALNYSNNLVVQYWFGALDTILYNGNKIIFSTVGKWYLDCGFGSWKPTGIRGVCDPYTPWQTFYNYRPWDHYPRYKSQVLGGEVCLWTEQVGVDTVETRIWPRTSAFAERVWSDLPKMEVYDVATRLSDQRERMYQRGFKVATVWPKWCSLNPTQCF